MVKNIIMHSLSNRTLAVIDGGLNFQSRRSAAAKRTETQIARSSPRRDPHAALQLHDGKGVCSLDQALYLFSRQATIRMC